jgi:phosphatidylserine decarboxylase
MFHREGQTIILTTFFIVSAIVLVSQYYLDIAWLRMTLQIAAVLILVLVLQFFRNPKRVVKLDFDEILSPVDGKVVVIEEVEETEYFKDKRRQVSIFMSPINVHVTRYPVSGTIKYSKYHPGKYLVAWHPKSSTDNERTTVVINTPKFGEVLYRQVAGALARRIVNYAEEGESVQQGEDAGFIKFGSRVDLFLPLDCAVAVKLDQNVVGAKTCIASIVQEKEDEEG